MAAVEITISGVLYDKYNRTQQNVVLIGEATLTGLQVGGGPLPGGPGQPQPPLGIWGGPYFPPVIWPNPPEGQAPLPEHPIVLPPDLPPEMPPPDSRPIDWKVAWTPTTGWVVIGVPTGAHPTPSK